jgi:uncharacterized protein YggU (UPF0235/DUF167 family)
MYIKVRVKTGQKKEVIEEKSKGNFVVSIKQKAERNMANQRIIQIFQEIFDTKQVKILSGHHAPRKMVSID